MKKLCLILALLLSVTMSGCGTTNLIGPSKTMNF